MADQRAEGDVFADAVDNLLPASTDTAVQSGYRPPQVPADLRSSRRRRATSEYRTPR